MYMMYLGSNEVTNHEGKCQHEHFHAVTSHLGTLLAINVNVMSVHAHTVYIGLYNLKPHWLCIYIACTMVIHVYTLYVHVMYMFYDLHTVHQHHIYYFLPFCPMLVDRNLQFCT